MGAAAEEGTATASGRWEPLPVVGPLASAKTRAGHNSRHVGVAQHSYIQLLKNILIFPAGFRGNLALLDLFPSFFPGDLSKWKVKAWWEPSPTALGF